MPRRMIAPRASDVFYTIRRLTTEWLDRAPSTLADPMGDLAAHLERWVKDGCPTDGARAARFPCYLDPSDPCGTCDACTGTAT